MYFNGKICFSILDSANFDETITDRIGFQPTKIIKKGKQLVGQQMAPYSIWMYDVEFDDDNFNEVLSKLTHFLQQYKISIVDMALQYTRVEINFYINTRYGQFGFSLPSVELAKISELGIDINFHLLSYGEVDG